MTTMDKATNISLSLKAPLAVRWIPATTVMAYLDKTDLRSRLFKTIFLTLV